MRFGNTIRKIPVILEEIKIQSKKNGYILKIVNGVKVSETERKKKVSTENNESFSICDEVMRYSERGVIPVALQKTKQKTKKIILKQFHDGHAGISRIKSLIRTLCLK